MQKRVMKHQITFDEFLVMVREDQKADLIDHDLFDLLAR